MTTDEIQDAIVDAAEDDTYHNIHDHAHVALHLEPVRDHIEEGWHWCRVSGFEVEYFEDEGTWVFRSILIDDEDDEGFAPVCDATFNSLARDLLKEAKQAYLLGSSEGDSGIDPNNPDEVDFVPVSNFSGKGLKKKVRRRG